MTAGRPDSIERRGLGLAIILSACLAIAALAGARPANAGTLTAPSSSGICQIGLSGTIQRGDFSKLKALISSRNIPTSWDTTTSICLDSEGGNLGEALRIAEFVMDEGIATVIEKDGRCLSACSLIFMMGHGYVGEISEIRRAMHYSARLGFHRPAIRIEGGSYDSTSVNSAFDAAIESVLKIVELANRTPSHDPTRLISPDLLREILLHEGDRFFEIRHIGQATEWQIGLTGTAFGGSAISAEQAADACINYQLEQRTITFAEIGILYDYDVTNYVKEIEIRNNFVLNAYNVGISREEDNAVACTVFFFRDFDNRSDFRLEIGKRTDCLTWRNGRHYLEGQLFGCETTAYRMSEKAYMVSPPDSNIDQVGIAAGQPATAGETSGQSRCVVFDARQQIIDDEPCTIETASGNALGTDAREARFFVWPSGARTVLVKRGNTVELNGKRTVTRNRTGFTNCHPNPATGNEFCYAE